MPNLTTIVNKTGRKFIWENILGKDGFYLYSSETGTVTLDGRTIKIIK